MKKLPANWVVTVAKTLGFVGKRIMPSDKRMEEGKVG